MASSGGRGRPRSALALEPEGQAVPALSAALLRGFPAAAGLKCGIRQLRGNRRSVERFTKAGAANFRREPRLALSWVTDRLVDVWVTSPSSSRTRQTETEHT